MASVDFNNLKAFIAVAREGSFTRAAAQLGVSQSALSHTIRKFEAQVGIRLLTRSTRGVSPTEAGAQLLQNIAPHYVGIETELAALGEFRDTPTGTFRITAHDHAVDTVLWPKLVPLIVDYPDIKLEISVQYGMIDIVAERYDAGVRLGSRVAKDMIAVCISPDQRMVVVGTPDYFLKKPPPQTPQDLTAHNCINLRLPTYGGLYAWEFRKDGVPLQIHVQGQLVFNTTQQMLRAALSGFGLAYVPEDLVREHVMEGQLKQVLDEWTPSFPGYHLYYPSRRQPSRAFILIVNTLRYSA